MHTTWWQRGIVYQIYPRSFMDGNGDGIGDLRGIRSRLDYLVSLGVEAIWLAPFHPSPVFGTVADFDELTADVHRRGLRLILDFEPKHTSDQHPWLVESRTSGDHPEGAHVPFNFQLIETPWNARCIAAMIDAYGKALPPGGWPNWALSNHDTPRIATRVGMAQARVAGMLLLTLRGTPTMYYGDEIGMRNVAISPDKVQDPSGKDPARPELPRDPCRTPMQWDSSPNAGFTQGVPWLPVDDDYPVVNVAAEADDPTSPLTLYRRLIALRREHPVLAVGDYRPLAMAGDLIAYIRELGTERFLVALNLGSDPLAVSFADAAGLRGRIVGSTYLDRSDEPADGEVNLRADEGLIIALR